MFRKGGTLVTALEALERGHAGARLTMVADAGMTDRDNGAALQARGTLYIPGARLKSRPAGRKRRIPEPDGYGAWGRDEFPRPGRPARPGHPVPQAGGDRGLLPREQARPGDQAGLPFEGAPGPCAHRHPLHGLPLPPARAPPAGGSGTPDGPGSDSADAERSADQHPARNEGLAEVRPSRRGISRCPADQQSARPEPEPGSVHSRAKVAGNSFLTASSIRQGYGKHPNLVLLSGGGMNDINAPVPQ